MDYTITNRKLSKQLADPVELVKTFGMSVAKRIQQRLREFEAAKHLGDIGRLPAANCHELKGKNAGLLAVDVSANYRLIFKPSEDPPASKKRRWLRLDCCD